LFITLYEIQYIKSQSYQEKVMFVREVEYTIGEIEGKITHF